MDKLKRKLSLVLQDNGYRLTAARQEIVSALVQSGGHVSADALADLVRDQSLGVGRMTVYRTLDLLCQLGAIRPVYQGTGAAHYVIMEDGHHHHLVCSSCGIVIELDECALKDIGDQVQGRFDFEVHGHVLELFGFCSSCQ